MWEASLDTLLARLNTNATFALAHSYGGYSTNLPLNDLSNKQAWIAFRYGGADLASEHGGPAHHAAGSRRARVLGRAQSGERVVPR
jgi:DMSO/TMAO reductase YedYZ molybdopterin-dependent catalytic subunit